MSEYGPCAAWQRFGLQCEVEFRPAGPPAGKWAMSDFLAIDAEGRYVLANDNLTGDIAGMAVSGWKAEGIFQDVFTINTSTQFILPFKDIPEDKHLFRPYGLTRVTPGVWAVDPSKTGANARVRIARFVQDVFANVGGTVAFEPVEGRLLPKNVDRIESPIMCLVTFLPPFGNYHPCYY